MVISVSLLDAETYKVKVVKGPGFEKDKQRIVDLPSRQIRYVEGSDGLDYFSHWEVPRSDIGELIRVFHMSGNMIATDKVERDMRIYSRIMRRIDKLEPIDQDELRALRVKKKPKLHQKNFILANRSKRRLINAFSTGLGKTFCAITRARLLGMTKMLVVTIGGIYDQWVSEFSEHSDKKIIQYAGGPEKRRQLRKQIKREGNIGLVLATWDNAWELATIRDFDAFVFDEAHLLANPQTQRYERLQPLIARTWDSGDISVQLCTATPQGNMPSNMWTLLKIIHPFLPGGYWSFRKRFEVVEKMATRNVAIRSEDGTTRWVKKSYATKVGTQNLKSLRRILDTCMIYDDGESIKDYVDDRKVIPIMMDKRQRQEYRKFRDKLNPEMNGRYFKTTDIRTKLLRLLQIAEGLINLDRDDVCSAKLDYCIDLIERLLKKEAHITDPRKRTKIVIWSRFRAITEELYKRFEDRAVLYNGSINRSHKILNKLAFNGLANENDYAMYQKLKKRYKGKFEPGEAQFFFGVMHERTALGMDLQSCAWQIFTSFSLSGYAMKQTLGRILRIGQKSKKVRTEFLVAVGTWEERALDMVMRKLDNAKMTLKGESLKKDNVRDMLKILKKYG